LQKILIDLIVSLGLVHDDSSDYCVHAQAVVDEDAAMGYAVVAVEGCA